MLDKQLKLTLSRQAHALRPTVIIGHKGLTEAIHDEINLALNTHELIKVRVNAETREDRLALIEVICDHQHADLVKTVGHVAVIYRKNSSDA